MTKDAENPERLFQQLDDLVADDINRFGGEGQGAAVVIETLQDVLAKRQLGYERDPDGAEDAVEGFRTNGPPPMDGVLTKRNECLPATGDLRCCQLPLSSSLDLTIRT